jgi:hypothetical protein
VSYVDELYGPRNRVLNPGSSRDFSVFCIIQISSGAHSTSHTICTEQSFPGLQRPEHENQHSPSPNAKV